MFLCVLYGVLAREKLHPKDIALRANTRKYVIPNVSRDRRRRVCHAAL